MWSSGLPTVATSGAAFLTDRRWGAWRGSLAVALLKDQGISLMRMDPTPGPTRVVATTRLPQAEGLGRIRALMQGPDGALWLTTSNGGGNDRIVRISPATNTPALVGGRLVQESGVALARTGTEVSAFVRSTGDAAVGTHPQNKASLGGKILRVRWDGGIPADNPFVGLGGNARYVWNYGHRNIQGLAQRPGTDELWSVEHGSDRDDEVNLVVKGANYGWDPVPGYNETRPMTDLVKFPDAIEAVWSSGNPTIAPSGGTFMQGEQWGGWNGNLVMAVLKGMHVRGLVLNADRVSVFREDVRITNQNRLRTAVQGPDGNLYLSQDLNPGAILRVVPSD
jgi:glucose/arabinose dehydrogenase